MSSISDITPEGERVQLMVEGGEREICVLVRDEGIGIHPRFQRRIFEEFFQVEDPLTPHHGGADLGLLVAARIVEAHGTRTEAVSELAKGAEFSFRLPTYRGEERVPPASVEARGPAECQHGGDR